jgi:hypothetical protein
MRARFVPLSFVALLAGCQPAPSTPHGPIDPDGFAGSYRKGAEWLDIGLSGDGYWLSIDSADHRDACLFVGRALRDSDGLKISLDAWRPGASLVLQHAGHGLVDIHPADDDDAFDPSYFCRGGASLAGRYSRVTPPAYRRGHIVQADEGLLFQPCGSRLSYLLTPPPGAAAPASSAPVELAVTVAVTTDLAGHAGRYVASAVLPAGASPPEECPSPAFQTK